MICYIVQESKNSPLYLSVIDRDREEYHIFPISVGNASRLARECSAAVDSAISGYSEKHAFQEVAVVLSQKFGET